MKRMSTMADAMVMMMMMKPKQCGNKPKKKKT